MSKLADKNGKKELLCPRGREFGFTNDVSEWAKKDRQTFLKIDDWHLFTIRRKAGPIERMAVMHLGSEFVQIGCHIGFDRSWITISSQQLSLRPDNGVVRFRTWFDGSGPLVQEWGLDSGSIHGVEIVTNDIKDLAGYLKKLMESRKAVFEFDTIEQGKKTLTVDTRALSYAMFPLLMECPL